MLAGGTHTMTELAGAMSAALGRRLILAPLPRLMAIIAGELGQLKWALTGRPQIISRRKVRDLLQPRWTCCWDKARTELGYREQITLADGIAQTAWWYAQEGWIEKIAD